MRIDALLAVRLNAVSRARASRFVRSGHIRVSDATVKPSYKVKPGEVVSGCLPPPDEPSVQPRAISLDVLYEDHDLIVVNKPPGLVVHPAPGHSDFTLVNALLHHCPDLSGIGGKIRPGIVHRLDKDTSGAIVAAKNDTAHIGLCEQFKSRTIEKTYLALVAGSMERHHGTIEHPIGRHPSNRKRMSIYSRNPRAALTQWELVTAFSSACLLRVSIKTGRTHQIRVHLAAEGHPVLGDPVYLGRQWENRIQKELPMLTGHLSRQMLHAVEIAFLHPRTNVRISLKAPLPEDMRTVLRLLRENR